MYRSLSTPTSGDPRAVGEYYVGWEGVGQLTEDAPIQESAMMAPTATQPVLDLTDPVAVRQLKAAMAMAPFMMPLIIGDQADPDFDEAFAENPIWDARATKFARLWLQEYKKAFPDNAAQADSLLVEPHLFPSALGALMALVILGYRQPVQVSVDFSQLDRLTTFFDDTGGDPSQGAVKAPFFSRDAQRGGVSKLQASTVAVAGLGLLGLVALGLAFGGKKRRRRR